MFVLALIPLSLILRKAKAAYKFSGSKEKNNHLLFMDDFKLYCRNEKELDSFAQTMHIFSIDYIEMEFSMDVSDRERKDCEISWCSVARC